MRMHRPVHPLRSLLLSMICAILSAWSLPAFAAPASAQPSAQASAIPVAVRHWESVGPGGGGAMYSPAFTPAGDGVSIACDMSGLYLSTDLARSWNIVDFRQFTAGPVSRVAFTANPQIFFAIRSSGKPFATHDGGRTWAPLESAEKLPRAFAIYADPAREDRLILGTADALFFSGDGGATLNKVYSAPAQPGLFVSGAFFSNHDIFVGTSAGLLRSADGGTSFEPVTVPGLPGKSEIVSFAGARQGATTRLFAVTAPAGSTEPGMTYDKLFHLAQPTGVFSLDWGAAAWQPRAAGLDPAHRLVHVGMATGDVSTVWLAGLARREESWAAVYRSTDGGVSWQNTFKPVNNENVQTGYEGWRGVFGYSWGGGAVGFAVHPTDPDKAIFTNYGFTYLTTDGGKAWRQAYLNPADQNPAGAPTPHDRSYRGIGLEVTSCWHITWADAGTVWASFTDICGCRSRDGGRSWGFDYTGHRENTSYNVVRHPATGTLYMASSEIHDLYKSTYLTDARIDRGHGCVRCSTDKGKTWQLLHDFGHPVIDVCLDPANPNTLYASVVHSKEGGVFKSSDIQLGEKSTWTKLPAPPRTQGHPFTLAALKDGSLVCTYSGRRENDGDGKFTDSSGIFVLAPGAGSWEDRSDKNMHYWVKDVVIDPHDPAQNTWYVGVQGGWNGPWDLNNDAGGLYKTTDRGRHWTRLLKRHGVTSCTVNPRDPNVMFVTTDADGLWYTVNLRSGKPGFYQDPTYPFHQPERVFFSPFKSGEVWVTSFGHGIRIGKM